MIYPTKNDSELLITENERRFLLQLKRLQAESRQHGTPRILTVVISESSTAMYAGFPAGLFKFDIV